MRLYRVAEVIHQRSARSHARLQRKIARVIACAELSISSNNARSLVHHLERRHSAHNDKHINKNMHTHVQFFFCLASARPVRGFKTYAARRSTFSVRPTRAFC